MDRRHFLTLFAGSTLALSGCQYWPDEGIWNPCPAEGLPPKLRDHALVQEAMEGIDANLLWDCHAHLIGVGNNNSGIWVNPDMQSIWNPIQKIQFAFYLNASCADVKDNIDQAFIERLNQLVTEMPLGIKAMLLAFDYHYDKKGNRVLSRSPFYTPNDYAQKIAKQFSARFEWIASVHPYRKDAIPVLEKTIQQGARAIKWLPAAMGIDPLSPQCDAFYEVLVKHNIPLLSHAGDEHAVDAGEYQVYGNPLRLRRALDHGVRVIVAHCATMGSNVDLDKGKHGTETENIKLFARLMNTPEYIKTLYGDISAITQVNRTQAAFDTIYKNTEWHDRLVYGSDYPLPGVMPIFSIDQFIARKALLPEQGKVLSAIRKFNPLFFDFLLKRMIKIDGVGLHSDVFHSKRFFEVQKEA